jgi:hypothetical protein
MRSVLYSLEDYFEALAEERKGPLTRAPALLLSFVCAVLGDALGARIGRPTLFPSPR